MKCEKCAKEIPADSKFCPYCGNEIAVQTQAGYSNEKVVADITQDAPLMKCAACGMDIPADSNYCPYCGADLSEMRHNVLEATANEAMGSVPEAIIQDPEEIEE